MAAPQTKERRPEVYIYLQKYDILPEKAEAYRAWAIEAIPRIRALPGLVELRGYRSIAGPAQVSVIYEFKDMTGLGRFQSHEEFLALDEELRCLVSNLTTEIWGPSPYAPMPLFPDES